MDIATAFTLLLDKNNSVAYKALRALQAESERSSNVYPYIDALGRMLDSGNSYIRTRALTLIAYNARWDTECKIDRLIDKYLRHVNDSKPITARQCIQLLPMLAREKPALREAILDALSQADPAIYASSMQPLVSQDIQAALEKIHGT